MIQATKVILVLFSVMIAVMQFPKDSLVVAQTDGILAQSNCPKCENKPTSVDTTLSIIGCIGSSLVVFYPWARVTKRIDGQESRMKDKWFMAFLCIVTQAYALWTAYSIEKCNCDARIYMIITSIIGVVFSGLYFLIGLVRGIGNVTTLVEKGIVALLFIAVVTLWGFNNIVNGYTVMGFTLVAHVCRILGTDYTCSSCAQCIVSIIGVVSGFLSIRHPHLIKARPFCTTSIVVAVIRFLELIWWLMLFVRSLPNKVRHWLQEEKSTQGGIREIEMQQRASLQQNRDEYMKQLQEFQELYDAAH